MSGWARRTGEVWTIESDAGQGVVMRLADDDWAYVVTRDERTVASGHSATLVEARAAVEVALGHAAR